MFKFYCSKKGKVDQLTLAVFISLFIVSAFLRNSSFDRWVQDFWFKTRIFFNSTARNSELVKKLFPLKKFNKDIVVFLIDETALFNIKEFDTSINDHGVFAKALNNLSKLNPKVVGLDVFFQNPNEKEKDKDIEFIKALHSLKDKIVLKSYQRVEESMSPPYHLFKKYANAGPIFFKNFSDKTIRAVSLRYRNDSGEYKSFQTYLWAKYNNYDLNDITFDDGFLKYKGHEIVKLINSQFLLLNYNRILKQSFYYRSFYDLYNNTVDESFIKDKIVIIGYDNSMVQEKYYTPSEGYQFSPALNALTVSNLIENNFLKQSNPIISTIITFIFLLILFFVFTHTSITISFIIAFSLDILLLLISLTGLMQFDTQIEIFPPLLAITLSCLFVIGKKYYVEFSEKKHIKSAFQHYVTASVVNEILKDPAKLNLHGEERNLSIFFSDIEGFTTLAEGMSPLDVVSLLNEYLTAMTDIIFEFNGLLDKYEGDAIMAVFGAPVDQSDHATRACRCALKNQKVLNQLRMKWKTEGKPEMKVRIGINTGIVVVGNMGSTMRFDYTVIGDNVNLAARLEAANKIFKSSILVSENTAKLAEKGIVSRKIATLKAVGKSVFTNVYELLADKESDSAAEIENATKAKENYEKANSLMEDRDFEQAEQILGIYLRDHEDDLPAKLLYSKIKGYLLVPPPPDWQNVIIQEK